MANTEYLSVSNEKKKNERKALEETLITFANTEFALVTRPRRRNRLNISRQTGVTVNKKCKVIKTYRDVYFQIGQIKKTTVTTSSHKRGFQRIPGVFLSVSNKFSFLILT